MDPGFELPGQSMEADASPKRPPQKHPFLGTFLEEYPFLGRWDQIPDHCHHVTRGGEPQPGTEPGLLTFRVSVLPSVLPGRKLMKFIPMQPGPASRTIQI